jgi:radical SAM protein with 4Fe4S-binding SPASM domain
MFRELKNYARILRKNSLPSWITFFVTNKCHLSCKHCFYAPHLNKDIKQLTLEEIKKISSSLKKVSKLFIGGGEPFLRDDLKEICEIFYKQNGTRLIYIPTNGILKDKIEETTRTILEKCKNCTLVITFSLEGTRKINDFIRGNGTFETTMDHLRYFCELKQKLKRLKIIVSSTISNYNFRTVLDLFSYLKSNVDIDYHTYDPVRNLARSPDPLLSLCPENWEELTKNALAFDEYYFRKGNQKHIKLMSHIFAKKYIYRIQRKSLESQRWPFECRAGDLFGVIEPDGDVKVCELIKNTIGNLREADYDFKRIWFSERAQTLRKQISDNRIETCRNCTNGCCCLVPSLLASPVHLLKAITGLYH